MEGKAKEKEKKNVTGNPRNCGPKMVRIVEEWGIQKGGDKWFKGVIELSDGDF